MTATPDHSRITDAAKLTAEERLYHATTFLHVEHFNCVHGHEDCSIKCGGVCIDEVLEYMMLHGEG